MLKSFPLPVGKRKRQSYNQLPTHEVDDLDYEKRYDSEEDDSYVSSADSTPYSSRVSSGILAPPRGRAASKPTVSAYSYRNPRAFTRYFGLAIASILILFMIFLLKIAGASARDVQLGIKKPPPPPPVWEAFPFLKRYHGGIRTLKSREENVPEYPRKEDIDPDAPPSKAGELQRTSAALEKRADEAEGTRPPLPLADVFSPYPDYKSQQYLDEYGPVAPCYLDLNDSIAIPPLRAYKGLTEGMPDNVIGSYDVLKLRNDVCFERFGRLGPYGLGYSRKFGGLGAGLEGDREGADHVWDSTPEVDFRGIKWGEAQDRCLEKNRLRFKPKSNSRNHYYQVMARKGPEDELTQSREVPYLAERNDSEKKATNGTLAPKPKFKHNKLLPRTCVLIRTWAGYRYDAEDIMYLRAMISELNIQSGGEYVVHFLIHVKDNNKQIWADDAVYQETLKNALPAEFEGMGTLWSEKQMSLVYSGLDEATFRDLPVYGAYRSTFMPVTYFAHQHPEFDFFWQWEMDIRYTGHYYHLFNQVSKWADKQPRKGLWERSARFYVPAVHESWEEFSAMVHVQTEHGTNSKANTWSSHLPPNPHMPEPETQKPEKPVWGPEVPFDFADIEIDDAVKPPSTIIEDKHQWGVGEPADLIVFNPLFDPDHTNWILREDVTGYNRSQGFPPRRTAINTSGRLSRRLLETMHREQAIHRHTMFSEMWPASCALHHGLKAVYAPHPVFIDRKWPVQYLAAIFNNGRNGASGGARLSIFSDERQHNFRGTTWYYDAGFAPNLWKRWLGYKVDNDGGEAEELAGEGRMCLPAVLLHPVKQVDLVIERAEGEE